MSYLGGSRGPLGEEEELTHFVMNADDQNRSFCSFIHNNNYCKKSVKSDDV